MREKNKRGKGGGGGGGGGGWEMSFGSSVQEVRKIEVSRNRDSIVVKL